MLGLGVGARVRVRVRVRVDARKACSAGHQYPTPNQALTLTLPPDLQRGAGAQRSLYLAISRYISLYLPSLQRGAGPHGCAALASEVDPLGEAAWSGLGLGLGLG